MKERALGVLQARSSETLGTALRSRHHFRDREMIGCHRREGDHAKGGSLRGQQRQVEVAMVLKCFGIFRFPVKGNSRGRAFPEGSDPKGDAGPRRLP